MSHYKDQGHVAGLPIPESLAICGMTPKDYGDLIQALFLAAPKESSAHAVRKFDSRGYTLATTELTRFLGAKCNGCS